MKYMILIITLLSQVAFTLGMDNCNDPRVTEYKRVLADMKRYDKEIWIPYLSRLEALQCALSHLDRSEESLVVLELITSAFKSMYLQVQFVHSLDAIQDPCSAD